MGGTGGARRGVGGGGGAMKGDRKAGGRGGGQSRVSGKPTVRVRSATSGHVERRVVVWGADAEDGGTLFWVVEGRGRAGQ